MKILLVSSSGGHLYKSFLLKDWWQHHQRVWITKDNAMAKNMLKHEKMIPGYFPENRDWLNAIKNTLLAIKVIYQEKPDLIFSLGAGIAPPFFLIAKLFKIKAIFMETFIFIPKATLSGKIIYRLNLADIFLVQNKEMLNIYPKAKFKGHVG